jgi:hypothetical protein
MSTTVNQESYGEAAEDEIVYRDQSILSLVSREHLERLVQICSKEGMAVLEYKDTGLVVIAERRGEDFVIWQVTKEIDAGENGSQD